MLIARHFVISGRVQRVGFRYFTLEAAIAEGLHGWVANLPDGRVEVVAEGERDAMERFERHIRSGPPAARVEHVERKDGAPTGRMTGFSIR